MYVMTMLLLLFIISKGTPELLVFLDLQEVQKIRITVLSGAFYLKYLRMALKFEST